MEGGSVAAYKTIRSYWRRHGYERLAPAGDSRRRRRFRVRVAPKVKILKLMSSPKRALLWLRDAYVRMMLGFANSRLFAAGGGGYYGTGSSSYSGQVGYGFGKAPLKEYDRKVIVEIYRSVVAAQGKLGDRPTVAERKLGYGCGPTRQHMLCSR